MAFVSDGYVLRLCRQLDPYMGTSRIRWYSNNNKFASTKGWVQSHGFSRRAGAGARFFTRDSQHASTRKSLASTAKRVFLFSERLARPLSNRTVRIFLTRVVSDFSFFYMLRTFLLICGGTVNKEGDFGGPGDDYFQSSFVYIKEGHAGEEGRDSE